MRSVNQAVRWGMIATNPCDNAIKPPKARNKRRVWTREEAWAFLDAVRGHRLEALYALLILTGLRRAEVIGLRWRAIDWEARTIRIDHTVVFINGVRRQKDSTKNPTSTRVFKVSPEVVEFLRSRRVAWENEQAIAAEKWVAGDYVFTTSIGTPIFENTVREEHAALIAKAGIKNITIHEMRHTYTSLARLAGVDIKEVARRLGHASTKTTEDIYHHLYEEQDESAALSSEQLFGPKKPNGAKNEHAVDERYSPNDEEDAA